MMMAAVVVAVFKVVVSLRSSSSGRSRSGRIRSISSGFY
jgi:hypothetical protein